MQVTVVFPSISYLAQRSKLDNKVAFWLFSSRSANVSAQDTQITHLNLLHAYSVGTHGITSQRKIPGNIPFLLMFTGDWELCRSKPIPGGKSRWTADRIYLMIINIPLGSCQCFVDCLFLILVSIVLRDKNVVCPVERCFIIISTFRMRVTRRKSQDSPSSCSNLRRNKVQTVSDQAQTQSLNDNEMNFDLTIHQIT